MGRDIKFRAWDASRKEWIDHGFCLRFDANGSGTLLNAFAQPFTEKTIIPLEWTGLKDCHGRDIYEGDIVATHPDEDYVRGIVRIGETEICEDMGERNYCTRYYGVYLERLYGFEEELLDGKLLVLGNIYEHPDLIEEKS